MLVLGQRGGKPFGLTTEQRSRHLHIIGASGTGKSKNYEFMIRQDLLARGRGLCVIDPHGTLADSLIQFCASRRLDQYRRVHIVEPSDLEWSVGFNPLHHDGATDPTFRVDTMVDACAQVWGGENLDETPLLATCLQLVFYALATHRLTLLEAFALTQASDTDGFRNTLTKHLPDFVYDSYWADLRNLPRKEREERFSSTRRRLLRFLGKPVVRRIIGQRDRVLDLRQIMDDGDVLIVNLAPRNGLTQQSARLLGTLLLNDFYLAALSRSKELAKRKPFYLYIDECYDFLTGDVENMLDGTRKFGLHLILAHQRLGQLRNRSEAIFNGVMTGAQTKLVFGGLTDEDAEVMAYEIMRDSFNLERPKHSLDRPIVVGDELIWLDSEGTSTSVSEGHSEVAFESWSDVAGTSLGESTAFDAPQFAVPVQTGIQTSTGESASASRGGSSGTTTSMSRSSSTSYGRHQALRPIYETRSTQLHSLEEEAHRAIVRLREQQNRSAIVKVRGQKAKGLSVPMVRDALASAQRIAEFRRNSLEASPYISRVTAADAEISERLKQLGLSHEMPAAQEEEWWSEVDSTEGVK